MLQLQTGQEFQESLPGYPSQGKEAADRQIISMFIVFFFMCSALLNQGRHYMQNSV